MSLEQGCCKFCKAPMLKPGAVCRICRKTDARDRRKVTELRETRDRVEEARKGFESRAVRYRNSPDERGLCNVPDYLKSACNWDTRESQRDWPTREECEQWGSGK